MRDHAGSPMLNPPGPGQRGPRDARVPGVSGSDLSSIRRPLIVLAAGTFAIGTDAFVIGGVLPAVGRSLAVSTSSAGLLVTAFAIAYAIGGPVLAVCTARLPRRALMLTALALFVAANILAALAPGYAMMLTARVLAAVGAAAFVPAASAAASSLAPARYRGRALATVVAGMTVAQVAGVPFGAYVGAWLGWRYTFIFVAALGAAAAVAVRLWLPHVQSPAPARLGRRLAVAARPSTWPLLLQTTLAMAAGFSVLTYIYPVLSRAGGYHGAMISVALLVFGVASVGGSTLGGRLTDRLGATPVVVAGLTALTLAMLAISAATALSAGWPVLIALAAWGLGGWTFPPAQQHRLIALAPEEASVLLGLNSSAIYAGAAVGGLAGGLVLPAGIALVPAIAAGLAACAVLCVAVQHHVAGRAGISAGKLVDGAALATALTDDEVASLASGAYKRRSSTGHQGDPAWHGDQLRRRRLLPFPRRPGCAVRVCRHQRHQQRQPLGGRYRDPDCNPRNHGRAAFGRIRGMSEPRTTPAAELRG